MIASLITLVLGFAAGCTFMELLGNKTSKSTTYSSNSHKQSPIKSQNNDCCENVSNHSNAFSLQSLKDIFETYNVSLLTDNSFDILLRKIRRTCYKDILKLFIEDAKSPEILVEMLKTQTTPNKDFAISPNGGKPFITIEKIDTYIVEEGISLSEFNSAKDKVRLLLSLYYTKGINDFKNTLGQELSDILSAHERGENIDEIYNEIMYLIRSRYSYIS